MLGSNEERIGPASSVELKIAKEVKNAGEVGHQILVCLSVFLLCQRTMPRKISDTAKRNQSQKSIAKTFQIDQNDGIKETIGRWKGDGRRKERRVTEEEGRPMCWGRRPFQKERFDLNL